VTPGTAIQAPGSRGHTGTPRPDGARARGDGSAGSAPTLVRVPCFFSVDMGIDLGHLQHARSVRGQGIVLNEPSVVAVRKGTNQVLNNGEAVGWVAKEMLGKTPAPSPPSAP
jgi:hypothetical protein